ncbi:hypothetical protein LCGC14_2301740 [marine sediment metagenome]|uniref:Uncharacterized protein n=1 Tax=marine sediment metagenome TaxID=412755 RepID=A0A0F9F0Q7_9ZZZZ
MPLYWDNDNNLWSEPLTDGNGAALTTGTVKAAVLSEDGETEYIAAGTMTLDAGVVWKRALTNAQIATITAGTRKVRIRITIGTDPNATRDRIEEMTNFVKTY